MLKTRCRAIIAPVPIVEDGSYAIEYGSYIIEHGSYATEDGSSVIEHGSHATEDGSHVIEHGNCATRDGNYVIQHGSYTIEDGGWMTEHDTLVTLRGSKLRWTRPTACVNGGRAYLTVSRFAVPIFRYLSCQIPPPRYVMSTCVRRSVPRYCSEPRYIEMLCRNDMMLKQGDILDLLVTYVSGDACWGLFGNLIGFVHHSGWSKERPIPDSAVPMEGHLLRVKVIHVVAPGEQLPAWSTFGGKFDVAFAGAVPGVAA